MFVYRHACECQMKSFLVVSPIYICDKDAFSGVTRGADGLMSDMIDSYVCFTRET